MPTGFVYATAVNSSLPADLPEDQRLGVYVFGVPRYRASVPYLALAPVDTLGDPATWRFFVGRDAGGRPQWATAEAWRRGAAADAGPAAWRPAGEAEIFTPAVPAGRCVGEFSIAWNPTLRQWLMLYNCRLAVFARVAPAPWGPWSAPTVVLGPEDHFGCTLFMTAEGCGNRRDYWPGKHIGGKFTAGGPYAPYALERFAAPEAGGGGAIVWLVSTWNPYQVVVMRTILRRGSASPAPGATPPAGAVK
jgi:hypothetical protein